MAKITRVKFKNGLRLIIIPEKEALTTTVAILVSAGSKYESKNISGVSHFLEHICFKGTSKYPNPEDISGELDGLGAHYNAMTGYEHTSYYAKVRNKTFKEVFDVVSDIYLNPIIRDKDVDTERGVIIEEINMYEDVPRQKVSDVFMELLYGNQPAGRNILGTKDTVGKLKKEDIVAYRNANYLPESTVVVVSGGIQAPTALSSVSKSFSKLQSGAKMKKERVEEFQTSPAEKCLYQKSEQTHVILGVRTFGINDKRKYALEVLSEILGGGMSSRLFIKVREKLGAAYYIDASSDMLSDHGMLTVSAGIDHKKIDIVIGAIVDEFKRMKKEKVGAKELEKAKEHLIGNLFMSIETTDALGYFYGLQEIMDEKLVSPNEMAKKIKAVTADDIIKVAKDVIKNNNLNLALVGPFKNRSFLDILKV